MKAKDFMGVIPPIMSSFSQDGELYEKGLREIIRFTLPHVNGYYPIGTYGCGPLMTLEERKKALEIVLDEVNGKVPVVAHVGAAGTKPMVELARHARSAGAAGVGAISPYYAPNLPEENLYSHFASLVDAVRTARPAGAKGQFIKRIVLTSTMGPGVKVDITEAMGLRVA